MTGRGRGWWSWARCAVCPFALERAEEALDLPVPAWCVGWDEDVAGAELGERFAERKARRVAHLALSDMTAWTGPHPCSVNQAAARRNVAETVSLFSAL